MNNPFTGETVKANEKLSDYIPLATERQEKYAQARQKFEEGSDFEQVVKITDEIITGVLSDLIRRVYIDLDPVVREKINNALNGKSINVLTLENIGKIIDNQETGLFTSLEKDLDQYSGVLMTYNFEQIGRLVTDFASMAKDKDAKKIAAHQLLNLAAILLASSEKMKLTPYHFLVNFNEITKEIQRVRDEQSKTKDATSQYSYLPVADDLEDERQFVWYKQRGMLLNKADQSRNIAFKVETFVNILKTIYNGIVDKNLPKNNNFDIDIVAREIIFDAGYKSGAQFGWTMHEIAQRKDFDDGDVDSIIELWCEFDSDVGFGMLSLEDSIKENDKRDKGLQYCIRLTDNFMVYKQDARDVNLCCFISGYIKGVMERLTGQPMTIQHVPQECAQFIANRNYCDFIVATDTDEYNKLIEEAREKYTQKKQK